MIIQARTKSSSEFSVWLVIKRHTAHVIKVSPWPAYLLAIASDGHRYCTPRSRILLYPYEISRIDVRTDHAHHMHANARTQCHTATTAVCSPWSIWLWADISIIDYGLSANLLWASFTSFKWDLNHWLRAWRSENSEAHRHSHHRYNCAAVTETGCAMSGKVCVLQHIQLFIHHIYVMVHAQDVKTTPPPWVTRLLQSGCQHRHTHVLLSACSKCSVQNKVDADRCLPHVDPHLQAGMCELFFARLFHLATSRINAVAEWRWNWRTTIKTSV